MTALLIGLLIVAAGAGGTWLALFRTNPARPASQADSRAPRALSETDTPPRIGHPRVVAREPLSPGRYDSSTDVRVGLARRLRSAVILAAVSVAIAATVGAAISAVVVVVVTIIG